MKRDFLWSVSRAALRADRNIYGSLNDIVVTRAGHLTQYRLHRTIHYARYLIVVILTDVRQLLGSYGQEPENTFKIRRREKWVGEGKERNETIKSQNEQLERKKNNSPI